MSEITVTLTEDEARAICPWSGDHSPEEWNRRIDRAEDAVAKVRQALREQEDGQIPEGQAALDGLAA